MAQLVGRPRCVGLVAIAEPARFTWPGYWIAVLAPDAAGAASDAVAALMFGTPAGIVLARKLRSWWVRRRVICQSSRATYLLHWTPALPARTAYPVTAGRVEAIALAARATGPVVLVPEAQAAAGRGLIGDRYASGAWDLHARARGGGRGYDLTLIEAEVLDELALPSGSRLGYADARRNLITAGSISMALSVGGSEWAMSSVWAAASASRARTWSV